MVSLPHACFFVSAVGSYACADRTRFSLCRHPERCSACLLLCSPCAYILIQKAYTLEYAHRRRGESPVNSNNNPKNCIKSLDTRSQQRGTFRLPSWWASRKFQASSIWNDTRRAMAAAATGLAGHQFIYFAATVCHPWVKCPLRIRQTHTHGHGHKHNKTNARVTGNRVSREWMRSV